MNNNINKIDNLFNNENLFNSYISNIEKNDIVIPQDLEKRLLNQFSSKIIVINTNRKKIKKNLLKTFKIVACTTCALLFWNWLSLNPTKSRFENSNNAINTHYAKLKDNINSAFKSANEYLYTPINLERID